MERAYALWTLSQSQIENWESSLILDHSIKTLNGSTIVYQPLTKYFLKCLAHVTSVNPMLFLDIKVDEESLNLLTFGTPFWLHRSNVFILEYIVPSVSTLDCIPQGRSSRMWKFPRWYHCMGNEWGRTWLRPQRRTLPHPNQCSKLKEVDIYTALVSSHSLITLYELTALHSTYYQIESWHVTVRRYGKLFRQICSKPIAEYISTLRYAGKTLHLWSSTTTTDCHSGDQKINHLSSMPQVL